jgi:hypothetical protein
MVFFREEAKSPWQSKQILEPTGSACDEGEDGCAFAGFKDEKLNK